MRTKKGASEIALARLHLMRNFHELAAEVTITNWEASLSDFVASMGTLSRPDDPAEELAALKKFELNTVATAPAIRRFEREVEALKSTQHPGVLKLIDANVEERWLVTEYHPSRSLAKAGPRYSGDALSALTASRSIVEAVAELHDKGYVHRDIKSNNVFLASDGRLVLGDFGIFFEDEEHTRVTETFERVGSRD